MGLFDTGNKDKRKEQIIRCVKLGMDLKTAMYTVACTEEEMEQLTNDESFLHRVEVTKAILEMNLLEDHHDAMQLQLAEGKTTAVQWKLERLNPNKWGKTTADNNPDNTPKIVIVEIPGLEEYMKSDLEEELDEEEKSGDN